MTGGAQVIHEGSAADNRYKLYSPDGGKTWELYDLTTDRSETEDLARKHPDLVKEIAAKLSAWRE